MTTVKISELPLLSTLDANTSNSLFMGVDLPTGTTGKFTAKTLAQGLYSNEVLNVGVNPVIFDNVTAQFSGSDAGYLQVNLQNFNGNASADYVITSDTGNNTSQFIDMGINGSTYNIPEYNAMQALDGYLFVIGPTVEGAQGNLVLGTASANAIVNFAVGGTTKENIVAKVTSTGLTLNGASILTFNDSSTQSVAAAPANYTQSAFNKANTADSDITIIQGVNNTQNATMVILEGVNNWQNNRVTAVDTFAGSAYTKANNALANTTGTFAGDLSITGNTSITGFVDIVKSNFDANIPLVHIIASDDGSYVAPSNSYYMMHITGKANNSTRFVLDSFGANTYPLISGRTGRGSAAAPASTANNDVLMRIVGNGYTGTQFPSSSPTKIDFVATENFSDTNRGTAIQFWNTPNGSNTIQKIASFNANEVQFTGVVNPQKGFIFTPRILPGAQTAITIDFSSDSTIKASLTADLTLSFSNYTAGKVVEVWLTNTGGLARTVTHGCSATNSSENATTFSIPGTSSAYLRYFSIDGDLANTFVTSSHA